MSTGQENTKSKHFKDGLIDFTAGSLGGMALVYVGQPLDTVKVKMQTSPLLHKNMFSCFTSTLKNDGIYRGLYAGTVPALVTNVVENSVLFVCYGFCQKIIQSLSGAKSVDHLGLLSNASAGFLASFFSSVAICPAELIKCKLQARDASHLGKTKDNVSPIKLTAQIVREEGIVGLFRGLIPTLVREMPGYFFFFGGYEGTRQLLTRPGQKKEDIGLLKTMIAGAVGGIFFWTSTFPVDVAKSRIQVSNIEENMVKVIYKISKQEGIGALYNGLAPTVMRTIPATATLFVTYEYSKKWLHFAFASDD